MQREPVSNSPRTLVLLLLLALTILSAPAAQERGEEETAFYTDRPTFTLAPDTRFTDTLSEQIADLDPRLGIEARFYLPVPPEILEQSDFELELYNILRSVSTMEGIEYYSASRDRMRTFYHDSYAVSGPEGDDRVSDPLVSRIPREERVYVFQRDSSFGKNVQQLDYTHIEGNFLIRMENLTTMFYNGFIPLVGDGNLLTYLIVEPQEEGIVFYGHLAVKVGALFGMEDRARNSFYNRIKALYDWFTQRMEEEFRL
ncbi:MAG: DUF6675 family protein [Spirochaetaceae bacterium]